MLQLQLADIKNFLLQYNLYINLGFSRVYQDVYNKTVSDGEQTIFPADNFGNYLYIRNLNTGTFDYNSIYKISDAVNGVGVTNNLVLVCCMRDADAEILLQNLTNTLRRYQKCTLHLTSFSSYKTAIVARELSQLSKGEIEATLQRMDESYIIVSIDFSISNLLPAEQLNCIKNPCKTC